MQIHTFHEARILNLSGIFENYHLYFNYANVTYKNSYSMNISVYDTLANSISTLLSMSESWIFMQLRYSL